MSTNTPLQELLALWVKYTDQVWGNPSIEVMAIDDTSYMLRYIQRGNKVEKRIQKSA